MAKFTMDRVFGMDCKQEDMFEEIGETARASARELPHWLAYEPFRDAVVQPSWPLKQPAAQRWSC